MTGYSDQSHRLAAARLVRFAQRQNVAPILRKHSSFLRTEGGAHVWHRLSLAGDLVLCGEISLDEHDATLSSLAAEISMPIYELRLVARLALEGIRCCFFGQGDRPIVDVEE